jgi:hypothetical protein
MGARSVMLPTLKAIPPVPQAGRRWRLGSVAVIVSTINVNGIRAAIKQRSAENLGLLPWLAETTADVVCLQETRADDDQLAAALAPALSDGWHLASAGGDVKGRNGVAVLSRHPIASVRDLGADEFALHRRKRLHPDRGGRHRSPAGKGTVHGGPRAPDGHPDRS